MDDALRQLLAATRAEEAKGEDIREDVISVSETVSMAASVYETLRNSLEYDEEHLLRRNAIRRILKRRLGEAEPLSLASGLLRELIWARYLPNGTVPERVTDEIARILEKYRPLFSAAESDPRLGHKAEEWLTDVLSAEIEYAISRPRLDESLASFAYLSLGKRMDWGARTLPEEDRDLQLYIAVHRAVLKSNRATLRFRLLTLYYAEWASADPDASVVSEIAGALGTVIDSVERQINHPFADRMYRIVRRHAIVYHLLRDIAVDDPAAFAAAVEGRETAALGTALARAATVRYDRFRARLRRSVVRAVAFLFLTKLVLALVIELPYERFVLKSTDLVPFATNVLFHPFLLAIIGLSVRIPEKKNNEKIMEEALALLGLGDDFAVHVKGGSEWGKGPVALVFRALYLAFFLLTIGVISTVLRLMHFNALSIAFFLFFLSLVTFFGLKLRNSRRELVIVETRTGIISTIFDILFLPIIRAGRWMALRAPRVNVFLFFFDFIVEAPFKAAIRLIEGWLAFLREKKEEI